MLHLPRLLLLLLGKAIADIVTTGKYRDIQRITVPYARILGITVPNNDVPAAGPDASADLEMIEA